MKTSAIAAVAVAILLAGAGGVYKWHSDREAERTRSIAEIVTAKKALRDRLTAFADAMAVAGNTPRISIGAPLLRLSDENRAMQNQTVPSCLTLAHTKGSGATSEGMRVLSKLLELPTDVDTSALSEMYVKGYTSAVRSALGEIDQACAVELASR